MNRSILIASALASFAGCATAPETRAEARSLEAQADVVVERFTDSDPSLQQTLDEAAAYVVFPFVGEAGLIAGGSAGVGVVYADGSPIGYAELREASFGAELGGQSYSQIVVLQTDDAFDRLRADDVDLNAEAGATMVRSGAGAQAPFQDGVAVFVDDEVGLMVEASLGIQSVTYQPRTSAMDEAP